MEKYNRKAKMCPFSFDAPTKTYYLCQREECELWVSQNYWHRGTKYKDGHCGLQKE